MQWIATFVIQLLNRNPEDQVVVVVFTVKILKIIQLCTSIIWEMFEKNLLDFKKLIFYYLKLNAIFVAFWKQRSAMLYIRRIFGRNQFVCFHDFSVIRQLLSILIDGSQYMSLTIE